MKARAVAFLATAVLGGALLTAQAGNNAGAEARSGLASASARKAAPSNAVVVVDVDKAIAQASQLLERADKLRQIGDLTRADLAEEAALEWAHAAHAALDAHEIALDADHLGEAADVAQKKADKARTALDAAIERRATLAAELAKLDAEATEKAMESLSQKPKAKPGKGGK
ncbi:MAG: hypothetical protein JNL79_37725 [Myxococcales bacterium]|nr:hypothetical protein [Myxococcales bacterium]